MNSKEESIESLALQLKEWGAQIDLLAEKTEQVPAEMARKYNDEIEVLRLKQRSASDKMNALKEPGGNVWGRLKETADGLWSDLKSGVTGVASKFK